MIRVKFGKEGALRFIGHLDVLRTFQKIFRRAGIPMVYSQGFSPHPIMSFALPLGLGLSSEGEYLDAEIEEMDPAQILPRLRGATSEDLPVYGVRILPEKAGNAMASVGRASYRVEIRTDQREIMGQAAARLMEQEQLIIEKKTKSQTLEMDLRPCLYQLRAEVRPGETPFLFMELAAGSKANIKPEIVWEELWRGIAEEAPAPLSIRRLDLMQEDGTSLGDLGEMC
ncbi:MAG: DUF2344 domain-containing protein [Lachnospiraceae bacterium]|nr:DUF2344 domain-containing protein [Lachnospiraceae bacterium]